MLRRMKESAGQVIGYAVEGEVTPQDVERIQEDIQAIDIAEDRVHLVLDVTALENTEPSALWQDLKGMREYARSLDRMAVVGDERWQRWATKASETVTDSRFFTPDEADEAWAWAGGEPYQ